MQPPIILPARKRLTWHVLLDMPVGLTPPRDTPEGPARSLILGGRAPDDGTEPGQPSASLKESRNRIRVTAKKDIRSEGRQGFPWRPSLLTRFWLRS